VERNNRFIARAEIETPNGKRYETVHVKNTGRLGELLVPGAAVYLEESSNPARKTAYDLVAVKKEDQIVNIDSSAPNKAVHEWIVKSGYFGNVTKIKPETTYKDSRFDFYVEAGNRKIFVEVKGVTLEHQRAALFPDAPSERAVRHLEELAKALEEGYESYCIFVIQMKGVDYFAPNRRMHTDFADTLEKVCKKGVRPLAFDCLVWENGMQIDRPVPVQFYEKQELLKHIAPPLLQWYDENKRTLPWRENPVPYYVWLSEIMLQQTRVEAVKPYFERFVQNIPDIAALAEVKEDVLLKLWEGLGYYNRARNLKYAAQQIMTEFEGSMPSEYDKLLTLKGIGSYTAGAVASIAFRQPVPAVDGNVLRVMARLTEDDGDIMQPSVKKELEKTLLDIIPTDRPGDFNQALMELGATVCIPNGTPLCAQCPWNTLCMAYRNRSWADYPKKSAKKPRTVEKKTILVIQDDDRVAIRKRPDKGLLAGMYEFPSVDGHLTLQEIHEYIRKKGIPAVRILSLPDSRHIFTHKEWDMKGYLVLTDALAPLYGKKEFLFVSPGETEKSYPIPSAFAAYSAYLHIRTGNEAFRNEPET